MAKNKNYVNNAHFLEAIIEYKKMCREAEDGGDEKPTVPDYIGTCLYQISNRLATKPNFSGYSYKDEMISDGLENAIQALGNFDPDKSKNPFAYFTQIIWYAFLRRIDKEKKQLYIRHKVIENSSIHGTIIDKDADTEGEAGFVDLNNEYMNDFVEGYERKIKKKREKTRTNRGMEKFLDDESTLERTTGKK